MISQQKFVDAIEMLKKHASTSLLLHKHSACLIKNGKVFSIGVNKYYDRNIIRGSGRLSVHAEVNALMSANLKQTKGFDILIIRVNKSLNLINSRPCNSCIEKMQQKGIRKAYYSDCEGNIVCEYIDVMPKTHESYRTDINKKKTLIYF
jgi:deoxycytidylate deaminase